MTNTSFSDTKISVLDLVSVKEGRSTKQAFEDTISLAQHAEKLGYNRYWMAEHHNMPAIASSATALAVSHVLHHTSEIRVGSGGVMLPNHAPLIIAEQFGTLETLFPGRVDLGLGRAPGTDQMTARAMRRHLESDPNEFPQQVDELRGYFRGDNPVHAYPGEGTDVPIWLLGSSGFSAQLAGQLGLPFSFASHFSPNNTHGALNLYRGSFKPSGELEQPYAMLGVHLIAADTDEEATRLATSLQQQFLNLVRGTTKLLQPPVDDIEQVWTSQEKMALHQQLGASIIGSKETVKRKLEKFQSETQADEIMITSPIYDHEARLRSYEIVSEIMKETNNH
ncbi:LLM class flavin-dependent oxidoreductase [Halobacillus sp. ACCC02827]|uniref:LLM class flavin-dependent oxidoreductase n=1 Tax=Bacillaceae TaxID=186817 RepID=UPI0002A4FFC1|nr:MULTISPECIES: LLM class flavin-dependent oxidoreductase [Bacillaceae]ELK44925.1 Luciferase-like monooxygenase family protein [Halobacillus sp. BAB-2008]QHT47045.1 LLM class flavin-dependent oxidoreductase [Bacillus sp. SB49]WJE14270.1 LLM class flavin-dependent oxidoreductase [Halobacillus sp. ACCC02827]